MKKVGEYTLTGRIPSRVETRVSLFDGKFDTAFRIDSIKCANVNNSTARESFIVVTTKQDVFGTTANEWDWSDNFQVAWAMYKTAVGSNEGSFFFSNVKDGNLIVEDLYLNVETDDTVFAEVNYEIKMTKFDISEAQGALAMVRSSSQGGVKDDA